MSEQFAVADLEHIFKHCFERDYATRLSAGAEEPLYQPASDSADYHTIYSTRDYFASALHEISHWCIAGAERRKLVDFGYWYEPDGRDAGQQAAFEAVEVKPQALEWVFAQCCGWPFRLSVDNLGAPEQGASETFKQAVHTQALHYLHGGLSLRARRFAEALGRHYRSAQWTLSDLSPQDFALSSL